MLSFVTPGYHSDNIKATQTSQLDNYNAQWLLHIIRMQKIIILTELSFDIGSLSCVKQSTVYDGNPMLFKICLETVDTCLHISGMLCNLYSVVCILFLIFCIFYFEFCILFARACTSEECFVMCASLHFRGSARTPTRCYKAY